jgi:hypothetical protein
VSFGHSSLAGLTILHNGYRRTYDFNGDRFTRRKTTSASLWLRPAKFLKLLGAAGVSAKKGSRPPFSSSRLGSAAVDYSNRYVSAGVEFKHQQSYGRIEYRSSDYEEDVAGSDERSSSRFKATAYTPLPLLPQIVLGSGFQHYENVVERSKDTLSANNVWGVARYSHRLGYTLRYTFMFDRASRTGDLVATDNIAHAVNIAKTWRARAGLMFGYGYRIKDDAYIERSGDQVSISGWLAINNSLSLRGGAGFLDDEVESGKALTGDRDYARHWFSARYRFEAAQARVRIDNRHRSNDDIGSEVDFLRFAVDGSYTVETYGLLSATYSFAEGEYRNSGGSFAYNEHVLSGEALSTEFRGLTVGCGGSYYRARQDVDIESFTIRVNGKYRLYRNLLLELTSAAHNFDDFDDLAPPYTKYYTANVVEASVLFQL